MSWLDLALLVLIALPVLPLAVVVMLIEHAWSDNLALRERTGIAIRDLLVAAVVSLLAANRLFNWNVSEVLLVPMFFLALIMVSAPSLIWIILYFRSGFR